MTIPLDIDTAVTAEVFTLLREADHLVLTGPCGPAPWLIEAGRTEHPLDSVRRIVTGAIDDVLLVHSTSWRFDRDTVVLSFVVVIGALGEMDGAPVGRADLARSQQTAAPESIAHAQVLEHGIRHLAWLAAEDPVVRATLDSGWHDILSRYVQEPFRQLG